MAKTKNESYMLPRTIIDDTHTVMLCNHFEARTRSYCGRLKANCHLHQEHAKVNIIFCIIIKIIKK